MFKGYWLLADLDGTLVPTPHRAQGQYVPLSECRTCEPLQHWLQNEGSVCIVTTADWRAVDQVYPALRPILLSSQQRGSSAQLLFSLYQGAALFYASPSLRIAIPAPNTPPSVSSRANETDKEDLHDLVRPVRSAGEKDPFEVVARREIVEVADYCLSCDSSISRNKAARLVALLQGMLIEFAADVLSDGTSSLLHPLSKRYQDMWEVVLKTLRHKAAEIERIAPTTRQEWIIFLQQQRQMFTQFGAIRPELVGLPAASGRKRKRDEAKRLLTAALRYPLTTPSAMLNSHNDEETGAQGREEPDAPRVVQLMLLGVPKSIHSRFFTTEMKSYLHDQLGVAPTSQPNSIIFSRVGIGKGTSLDYLCGASSTAQQVIENRSESSFFGRLEKQSGSQLFSSISIADCPFTVDKDMASRSNMLFVSLEDPHNVSKNRKGTSLPHFHTVGYEHDGGAEFLKHLVTLATAEVGSPLPFTKFEALVKQASAEAARDLTKRYSTQRLVASL